MRLRVQGLVWTLCLSLGLGALGLGALTLLLQRGLGEVERARLAHDAARLQDSLAVAVQQRSRAAREWSNWTELRRFVHQPRAEFVRDSLTPTALKNAGFDWAIVLNRAGEPIWSARADGSALDVQALLQRGHPRGQRLRQPPPEPGRCALERWMGRLQVLCCMRIRDDEGRAPAVGVLLTGELLEGDKLAELSHLLALDFQVLPANAERSGSVLEWPAFPGATLGVQDERFVLTWPLRNGQEPPHSLLRLDWPRVARTQIQQALRLGQAGLAGLSVLLSLAVLGLVEWRLVRRLRRLQRELSAVRAGEQWQRRVSVRGDDELSSLASECNRLLERIDGHLQTLSRQSRTDSLTGLSNRRAFGERLRQALARCRRSGQPLCLLMLDVDRFKAFNDRHGHLAGDRALQALAAAMQRVSQRGGDLAARWGGEEFALLFEDLPAEQAAARMATLRALLAATPVGEGQALAATLTVSGGLAVARAEDDAASLVGRADEALYRAKLNGRDRLEWEAPEVSAAAPPAANPTPHE